MHLLLATSQHRAAPPPGGKHHAAERWGPWPQLQGSLPAGRHQGRTRWHRGEEREHGWWLHRGAGVSGGKREEPTVGRGGRQQWGRSETDSRETRGRGELGCPHGSHHSVQGTAPCVPSLCSPTFGALLKQTENKRGDKDRTTLLLWLIIQSLHLLSLSDISKGWQDAQITESPWLKKSSLVSAHACAKNAFGVKMNRCAGA